MSFKKIIFSFVLIFIVLIFISGISELILSLLPQKFIKPYLPLDEKNLCYEYHPTLGWFPKKNFSMKIQGYEVISIQNNSYGFRDKQKYDYNKKKILTPTQIDYFSH